MNFPASSPRLFSQAQVATPTPWTWMPLLLLLLLPHSIHAAPSPQQELAQLQVLPGFQVNLFASEKDQVVKPIQVRFDHRGRLWVAGSRTYPQLKPGENPSDDIVVLEDTNHDGVADQSTLFATGLHIPMGMEIAPQGVYVGAATELLLLQDTDGDGRADVKKVVLSGFGTGDTHQTINSFCWGPSGELLFSQGLHGFSHVETPWGIERLIQAGVWRWWPRSMRLDPFWNGAMGAHNPFGNVFDRWGQPFVFAGNGHGIYHLTPATIRTDHFLEHPWIWNQGRKFGGADFVENAHWPDHHQGEVISGGYLQNTVERFKLTRQGAQYQAERLPPLVQTTNTAFRIVDVRFGPDGGLYLCDWYNPVIGHYQTSFRHPDRDKLHGRIWRVTAQNRPLLQPQLPPTQDPLPWLASLPSPHRWEREMARMILNGLPRNLLLQPLEKAITATLASPVRNTSEDHFRTQLLGLGLAHGLIVPELLDRVSQCETPEARAFAARAIGQWAYLQCSPSTKDHELSLLQRLTPLLADPDPLVRLEAVVACSYIPHASAIEYAVSIVDLPTSPALEYALVQTLHALKPFWEKINATSPLTFAGKAHRLNWFTSHNQTADAVSHAAGRLRRVIEVALDLDTVKTLSRTVALQGSPKDLTSLLPMRHFTVGTNYVPSVHAEALTLAARTSVQRKVLPSDPLSNSIQTLLIQPHPDVRKAALLLVGAWQVQPLYPQLTELLQSTQTPEDLQQSAIQALGWSRMPEAPNLLARVARAHPLTTLRTAALAQWITYQIPEAMQVTLELWTDHPETVDALFPGILSRKEVLEWLERAWAEKPPSPQVAQRALPLLAASGRHQDSLNRLLLKSAAQWKADSTQRTPERYAELATAALQRGNPTRGQILFNHPNLACARCHSTDGSPGKIGPDLSPLGTAQTPVFIVGALLEPQKEVKEGFMAFEITTTDDVTYQGYLRGQTDQTVSIHDHLSAQTIALPRTQIREQRQIGTLMPSGLADSLTDQEFSDLIAFLAQLGRSPRAQTP